MDQEQGAVATAVEAEVIRIVRTADQVGSYRSDMIRPYGYKILREAIPGFTRDRWKEITEQDPDISVSEAPEDVEQRRAQQQERERARQAQRAEHAEAVTLLQAHGEPTCCRECDMPRAERLRARLGLPGQPVTVVPDEDEDEDEDDHVHTGGPCLECNGGPACGGLNRWGEGTDCDTGCPDCERCDSSHPCQNCGLDPHCEHVWECTECEQPVTWERDHWELVDY
jgi:hypothetical protein